MPKAPRAGSKLRQEFDARQILANWAGVDLTRINGLGLAAVMKVLSEIGPDLSRFETVKHFCSWLGLCPGTKISGGKILSAKTKRSVNRVRQALKMAAMSLSHSDSALGAFYRRLSGRMDKPRANTATAHKLGGWCTSCSRAARPMSIRVSSTTRSSSASAALPLSNAALPPSASRSIQSPCQHDACLQTALFLMRARRQRRLSLRLFAALAHGFARPAQHPHSKWYRA